MLMCPIWHSCVLMCPVWLEGIYYFSVLKHHLCKFSTQFICWICFFSINIIGFICFTGHPPQLPIVQDVNKSTVNLTLWSKPTNMLFLMSCWQQFEHPTVHAYQKVYTFLFSIIDHCKCINSIIQITMSTTVHCFCVCANVLFGFWKVLAGTEAVDRFWHWHFVSSKHKIYRQCYCIFQVFNQCGGTQLLLL